MHEDVALHCSITSQLHIMLIAIGYLATSLSNLFIQHHLAALLIRKCLAAFEESLNEKAINNSTKKNVQLIYQKDNNKNTGTFIAAQPFTCGECIYTT